METEAEGDLNKNGYDHIKRWTNIEGYDEIVRRAQDQERWRVMTAN